MQTINRAIRSRGVVTVPLIDERPVRRFDRATGLHFNEAVMMRGVVWRADRRQVPLLDSGDRSTVKAVIGSVRSLRVEGDSLLGELHWARDERSQAAKVKYQAGDIGRFTLSFQPLEVSMLVAGETMRTRAGILRGPCHLVTRWSPLDCSIGVHVD